MDGECVMLSMKKGGEIDTSRPFCSVKEAVLLFGERVLATELYADKLTEMHETGNNNDQVSSRIGLVAAELEETKESLQKAREESMVMATCLSSLQEELEKTKRELQQLKQREFEKQILIGSENEDIKFIEHSPNFEVKTEAPGEKIEYQKKRFVTFGNQPSISQVMVPPPPNEAVLKRHPSLRQKKKKSLIPLIGGIFSKKKCSSELE